MREKKENSESIAYDHSQLKLCKNNQEFGHLADFTLKQN